MPPGAVLSLGVRCQLRCHLFSVPSSKPIECSLKQEFQGEDEKCSTNADWTGGAGCKVCWAGLWGERAIDANRHWVTISLRLLRATRSTKASETRMGPMVLTSSTFAQAA